MLEMSLNALGRFWQVLSVEPRVSQLPWKFQVSQTNIRPPVLPLALFLLLLLSLELLSAVVGANAGAEAGCPVQAAGGEGQSGLRPPSVFPTVPCGIVGSSRRLSGECKGRKCEGEVGFIFFSFLSMFIHTFILGI